MTENKNEQKDEATVYVFRTNAWYSKWKAITVDYHGLVANLLTKACTAGVEHIYTNDKDGKNTSVMINLSEVRKHIVSRCSLLVDVETMPFTTLEEKIEDEISINKTMNKK